MSFYPFGAGTYYLGSSLGSTDTTILLSSFTEPVTGTPYTMALLNSTIVYATIAPKTTSSEFISFTGITQNANGTATLTGVVRGLAKKYPFTTDSAYKLPHSGQSTFIISDAPQLFESFMTLANAETITGLKTFPGGGNANAPVSGTVYSAPTNDLEYASKKYVDSVAIAGAPNATTTVKGIVQQATTSQINAGTGTGSTGASLFAAPDGLAASIYGLQLPTSAQKDALAGTGTPSGSNKFVTADTDALKELLSNKSTTTTLGTSNTLYPSQNAVKTYVDTYTVHKTGTATKDASDASTTQNIAHGLGRVPLFVSIVALGPLPGGKAFTKYDGTTQSSVSTTLTGVGTVQVVSTFALNTATGAGTATQTGVVTFDATNIIITWTKGASPTGVYTLLWEAQ